ncbi:YhcN/YlaJ family sporulation lipoprotein [Melghirimyces profundicolus]|uniref:YhcN/YlaJ family sporulation lipoprotein n=1 Tax=Melghirimyces profundicolus TaxID=1242148 RepID=A0A2T6C9Q7_9BACL|nr:YhcN/YlaJ family sporulation lipoprotein [Melghirimyces profundicolus]PTX65069.1 YhcN/YlaJ family sporulation lipoprotein [Melghirimyces profundicolus]
MIRVLTWILTIGLLVGCQQANKPPANESAPPPNVPRTERVKQTAPEPRHTDSNQAVARRMVKIATQMPQVKSATSVVIGGYTLVGINLDPTLDRSRSGTVKYAVAQALHEDPQGANALVTADPDLVQRIRELADDLNKGRPVAGLAEELADIAARISPQPSRNTPQKEEQPSRTDQEKMNQTRNPRPPRQNQP